MNLLAALVGGKSEKPTRRAVTPFRALPLRTAFAWARTFAEAEECLPTA